MKQFLVASLLLISLCLPVSPQVRGTGRISGTGFITTTLDSSKLSSTTFSYRANKLASCVPGTPLSTFTDSTALHNDATGSGSARPTTEVVGGRCVTKWDGVNDAMTNAGLNQDTRSTTLFLVLIPNRMYAIESPIGLGANKVVPVAYNGAWTYWGDVGITTVSPSPLIMNNYVGPDVYNPTVLMIQHTASGTLMRVNGVDSTGVAIASATINDLTLGQFSNNSAYFDGYILVAEGHRDITDANRDAAYNQFVTDYRYTYSTTQNLIVFIGSSNTLGFRETTQPNSYPGVLLDALKGDGKIYQGYNDGVSGQSFGGMSARLATYITPLYSAGRSKNIAIISVAAYVDLVGGASGADTYTLLTSLVSSLKATGWTVIVTTQTPSAHPSWTAAVETQRGLFNSAVMNNAAGADCAVNTDGVANLTVPTNATYFYNDAGTFDGHLTGDSSTAGLGQLAQQAIFTQCHSMF